MKTDRRSFLKGVLGTTAVVLLPKDLSFAGLKEGGSLALPDTRIVSAKDLSSLDPPFGVTGWEIVGDRVPQIVGLHGMRLEQPGKREAVIHSEFFEAYHSYSEVGHLFTESKEVTWRLPISWIDKERGDIEPIVSGVIESLELLSAVGSLTSAKIRMRLTNIVYNYGGLV